LIFHGTVKFEFLRNESLGNYRNRLDIIADILNVVSQNAKKTQIMYQANLSYKVLQRYLAEVMGASLINFKEEEQCYMLTAKGRKYLENYQDYSKTNKYIEKKLNDARTKEKTLNDLCSKKEFFLSAKGSIMKTLDSTDAN
jgi:predicted transcriptional regulator